MTEIPANLTHQIDQAYPEGRDDMLRLVEEARQLLADKGPAMAAARMSAQLTLSGWEADMLSGLAGVALVELARREHPRTDFAEVVEAAWLVACSYGELTDHLTPHMALSRAHVETVVRRIAPMLRESGRTD